MLSLSSRVRNDFGQNTNFAPKYFYLSAKLTRNISYLTLSQFANYVFPLATIPYITRVVGPENYGLIEFATVALLYFIAVVDYSFHTTATRKIAALTGKPDKIATIFSAVMVAKAILFTVALSIFGVLVFFVPEFRKNSYLFWISFPIVLGWALYPNFLFYGLQKVGVVALANVVIKGLAAVLIFVFINQMNDYYYVPFINGITQLAVGFLTLVYALKQMPYLRTKLPKQKAVKAVLWEGRFIFLSNFFTRIYGFGSILIGGFLLTPLQLGIFAAASKLINVAQSFLFQPLHGALFPYLSQKLSAGMSEFRKGHRQGLLLLAGITALATIALMLLAPFAVQLIFGSEYQTSAHLILIMAPMLFIGAFGHMHLQQGLLILREDKSYMVIVITTGLLSIALNIWLMKAFDVEGAAWVRLLTEAVVAFMAIVLFYQKAKKANATG